MRIIKSNLLSKVIFEGIINYPVYTNLSYFWNFGILSFLCFIIQIVSGIFLAMYYVADTIHAFNSIENIMREINYGWLIRYIHANGASFFFACVYIHLFRNLYYISYLKPRLITWFSGIFILLLMIIIAFIGYVLPWGQMSFWAATVITNLFTAIPYIGENIVLWLWGGFSVGNATLNRFYSLHYLLPFILAFLILLHVLFLHEKGSTNPLGINIKMDKVVFTPYHYYKDFVSIIIFIWLFIIIIFFYPNILGHPDNYIMANALITPPHIVPEWYFLPFHAILRSVPNKLGGIFILICAISLLLLIPLINRSKNKLNFSNKYIFWSFLLNGISLGWIGGQPVEYPYIIIGQLLTISYFLYFVVLLNMRQIDINMLKSKIDNIYSNMMSSLYNTSKHKFQKVKMSYKKFIKYFTKVMIYYVEKIYNLIMCLEWKNVRKSKFWIK